MMSCKVLSTKKLDPLLIEQAKQNGIDIIEHEFISIQPSFSEEKLTHITELIKSGIKHLVFTSSSAVYVLKALFQNNNAINNLKIFCLSGKTKETIIKTGFPEKKIIALANDASSLAKEIIRKRISKIIFCCGNQRKDDLPFQLVEAGITVHEIVVYDTIETAKKIADNFSAILFFSPSAVKSFFSLNQLNESAICFAIGQTTADSISNFTSNKIMTSEFPSQESMINSVQNYFQNINCYE